MEDTKLELLSVIEDILGNKVNLIDGVRIINHLKNKREDIEDNIFNTFVYVGSETDSYPRGSVRDTWNDESLLRIDKEAEDSIKDFRSDIETACKMLRSYLREI